MTYFVKEMTYAIMPDKQYELRDSCQGRIVDKDGTMLAAAENKFYAKIANELETEAMYGNNLMEQQDMLRIQEWYLDDACTMLALHLEISEHQLMHNLSVGVDNALPECDIELRACNMLHEVEIPTEHSDIEITLERLYRSHDGSFVLVVNRKAVAPNIKWYHEKHRITEQEAAMWAKKYMNTWMYKQVFGMFEPDDDIIPAAFMLPKDTLKKLNRFAKTTNQTTNNVVQNALNAYLK